jgi:trimeric autotransporter adhesin
MQYSYGTAKKLIVLAIGGTLLLQPLALMPGVVHANGETATVAKAEIGTVNVAPQLVVIGENIITSGATRKDYQWITTAKDGVQTISNVHVIEIDLTNPYVSLNAMNGKGGTLPSKASVTSMVKDTGAVAGVNADYFDTQSVEQVPFGAQIANGMLVKSPRLLPGMFMFGLTADRVPLVDRFTFEGTVVSADGTAIPLAGMNEAAYSAAESNIAYSHANALYLYTSAWTAAERPNRLASAATPTEVLVQSGIVTQVAENATLPVTVPADGFILRGHGTAAKQLLEHYPVGTSVSAEMKLRSVTSQKTFDPSSFRMMVGGHTILVNDGQPSSYSRSVSSLSPSTDRARTAVGYSKDMKKVYLITAEDNGPSVGVTLAELQKIMVQLGVWKGVNLDGGGSTTMVDRPLGEFDVKLSHPTEDGNGGTYQRPVVNGIGVYTSAPQGALKGVKASGKSLLFIGEQTEYKLTAYDTYYNPLDPSGIAPVWSLDKPALATLSGGILTAATPGQAELTVKAGDSSDKLAIEVIGESRIHKLAIEAPASELRAGAVLAAKVQATLEDGRKLTVPAGSVDWEFRGFLGSVQDDKIRVDAVKEGATVGYAIARYDGYSAMVTMTAGSAQRAFQDFEKVTFGITATSDPVQVGTGVQLVTGLGGNASKALKLNYDFALSTEDRTKAAYAVLNGGGITLTGEPIGMSVDVYGDNGRNWLRATIVDAAGTAHKVDLAKAVDWSGWKTVKADFTGLPIQYPAKLQSLYIATVKEGQDERALSGEIAFDNIVLHDAPKLAATGTKILLTLDKKTALVNGKKAALDVAPIALDGVTYLPFRFVADAMGGQVVWDNTRKQVTALRGDKLLEMWLGKETLIINGERKTAGTMPIVRGGRTLVPLRLVSEQLGLQVDWDGKTKTITIQ